MKRMVMLGLALAALLTAGCNGLGSGKAAFADLVYTRTGGIAGFDQKLTLSSDGSYQITEKGKQGSSGKLPANLVKEVNALVQQVRWASVKSEYLDPKVVDAIYEGVTVKSGKDSYTTRVGTGGAAPPELTRLLGELNQLLSNYR